MELGVVWSASDVLVDFAVDQDAGSRLAVLNPGIDQLERDGPAQEVGRHHGGIEQVAPHSSNGGVGLVSCRMRSSSSSMSGPPSSSMCFQAPARLRARRRLAVSFDSAASASSSEVK